MTRRHRRSWRGMLAGLGIVASAVQTMGGPVADADAAAWFRVVVTDARRIVDVEDPDYALSQKAELCATASGYLLALGDEAGAGPGLKVYDLALAGLADVEGDGTAEGAMVEACVRAGRIDTARQLLDRMAHPDDRAMAKARGAKLAFQAGDAGQAKAWLAEAADDADAGEAKWGAPDGAWSWYYLADAYCDAGDLGAVEKLQARINDTAGKAETLARLATEYALRGDPKAAEVALGLAYQQYQTTRRRWDHDDDYYADPVYIEIELARAHAALGQTDQALNLADRMDDADYTAAAYGHTALEQRHRGDERGARATIRSGLEQVAAGVDNYWFSWGLSELIRAAVVCGEYDAAVDLREKVTDQPARAWAALGIATGLYERDHAEPED